ncbi:MAG: hypothetical protein WAU49_06885 [Steroidobacteraceae bacterium]
MNLSLIDAFGRFGAKPSSRLGSLSAMATDGAMVLSCLPAYFGHPASGVLRYEGRLSTVEAESKEIGNLGEHLTHARDGSLPVRMVVKSPAPEKNGAKTRTYHIRPDLIGKVVEFDGDHFIVDFTRQEPPRSAAVITKRK